MSERRDLPRAVKQRVLARYDHCCAQCGSDDRPEVDHIVPWVISQDDSEDNLQVLCFTCNRRKGARLEGERGTHFAGRWFPDGPVPA
ncbi:HNH endonuclease [Rhodococcus sp. LW-XY12]|uniref:HNH endonuclease n=1 Tax=Rhodococcus sp. LW-XY12 TaxID=2856851 RepID=UPI001C56FAD3|nr:HNH endonuclease [Rhodococcus sp. LW-XY12]QXU55209.1 HNH endonuclease [Rhodococcus sp. LW-XY12]